MKPYRLIGDLAVDHSAGLNCERANVVAIEVVVEPDGAAAGG